MLISITPMYVSWLHKKLHSYLYSKDYVILFRGILLTLYRENVIIFKISEGPDPTEPPSTSSCANIYSVSFIGIE